jgi:hypothetical protein
MKFTDLSVLDASNKPERVSLDGYVLKVGENVLSLDGQWIDIVGIDSQQFKNMKLRMQREALEKENSRTHDEIDNLIKSSLIVAWSFDEECNEVNKLQALKIWPSAIVNFIVKLSESRVDINFTKGKLSN